MIAHRLSTIVSSEYRVDCRVGTGQGYGGGNVSRASVISRHQQNKQKKKSKEEDEEIEQEES